MPAARLPLRPSPAERAATLAAVEARLALRREHARLALGLLFARASDAEVDSSALGYGLAAYGRKTSRLGHFSVRDAAQAERARREALDCPYTEHVEENPYNGVVLCHGCGITLHTFAEGEY